MPRTPAVVALAAAVAVGVGACGGGGSGGPAPPGTTTTSLSPAQLDKARAQRVVLTAADLPGYTTDPPGAARDSAEFEAAADACVRNNPLIVALGEDDDPRGASSPGFRRGDTVRVTSSVTFGDTEAAARTVMADLGAPSFPACFSAAFTAELRKDAANSDVAVTTTTLPADQLGDQSVAFRTVARFRTQGTNVTLNIDFTFVRVGRGFGSVQDLSATTAFPDAERIRLATALATRMATP